VRIVDFHGDGVLRERPLDLVDDVRVHGDNIVALPEADHGEVAARQLNAVVLVDEVEDRAGDPEEGLLVVFSTSFCRRNLIFYPSTEFKK